MCRRNTIKTEMDFTLFGSVLILEEQRVSLLGALLIPLRQLEMDFIYVDYK